MAGSWTTIANPAPAPVATMLLLTDGTVLAQGVSTRKWYRYTPAANGSYQNGTWATMADSVHAPLYYASGVLRDGRVIVAGGEYDAGAAVWLLNVEMYDPQANTWTTLPNPPGWVRIGDAPGCVLPDGRFFLGQVAARNTAIYNPATNTWTVADDKINTVSEESWSLLYDGTIHAVDCSNPPNAEKYIIAADQWVGAGATLDTLVDSISEIGASVLLPDGRIFVIGATNFTALYTPPPIANQVGTWARGPSFPQVNPGQPLGAVDAPACVLPNGKVLFTLGPITSPASFNAPTFFMEYDPITNSIASVPAAASSAAVPYKGRMVMLPTGQVFYTQHTSTPMLYTPDLAPDPVWRPTITSCPSSINRGRSFTLHGRQINGLTQCSYYGNDATNATNYPIVRLESNTSSDVYYCRTHTFSTMGLNTGTVVHTTRVFVPSSVPLGAYCLRLIANGIATASCKNVTVTTKRFKELKYEIKEKLEILENLKEIKDLTLKRVPDIDDIKGIREDIDIFKQIDEEWTRVVTTIAASVDETNAELTRAFIGKEERPDVGTPEPEIEELPIPRISAAEAKQRQEKEAFAEGDDRKVQMTELGEATHEVIHNISRSGGKVDLRTDRAMLDAGRNLRGTSARVDGNVCDRGEGKREEGSSQEDASEEDRSKEDDCEEGTRQEDRSEEDDTSPVSVIVVLGSRHDQVATNLVAAWPGAALCDAADLVSPGWTWMADGPRTWVVAGARVPDGQVSGVFVRRSTVHPAELVGVHADDRAYLAAETHAFLVFVLATTEAVVANPVGDGALGEEAVRPERWMPLAIECGLRLAPLRLTTASQARRHFTPRTVEVVGDEAFVGDGVSPRCRAGAVRLAAQLEMRWCTCVFDGHHRLVAVTTATVPSAEATSALGTMLRGAA